jgi:hypothetical protein
MKRTRSGSDSENKSPKVACVQESAQEKASDVCTENEHPVDVEVPNIVCQKTDFNCKSPELTPAKIPLSSIVAWPELTPAKIPLSSIAAVDIEAPIVDEKPSAVKASDIQEESPPHDEPVLSESTVKNGKTVEVPLTKEDEVPLTKEDEVFDECSGTEPVCTEKCKSAASMEPEQASVQETIDTF